jgi:hypothetical protein
MTRDTPWARRPSDDLRPGDQRLEARSSRNGAAASAAESRVTAALSTATTIIWVMNRPQTGQGSPPRRVRRWKVADDPAGRQRGDGQAERHHQEDPGQEAGDARLHHYRRHPDAMLALLGRPATWNAFV